MQIRSAIGNRLFKKFLQKHMLHLTFNIRHLTIWSGVNCQLSIVIFLPTLNLKRLIRRLHLRFVAAQPVLDHRQAGALEEGKGLRLVEE